MKLPLHKIKTTQSAMDERLRKLTAKQAVVAIVVLVLLAIPPVFVSHPIGYLPLVAFVFTLLFSWLYLRIAAKRFDVYPSAEETSCTRASSTSMSIDLRNRSALPLFKVQPCFYVTNPYGQLEQEDSSLVFVDGKDAVQVGVSVTLGHIGTYAAGISNVILFDPLGLFHANVKCDGASTIISTPQVFEIESVEFDRAIMHESPAPVRTVISDDVDYAGVRDYEFGDPMKSIHWKLSARTEDLFTRLFESNVSSSTSVVMDFHSPDYSFERLMCCSDAVAELALACARLAKSKGMNVRLVYGNAEGGKTAEDTPNINLLEEFTQDLPLMSSEVPSDIAEHIVQEECTGTHGSDNLILCTSLLERSMASRLIAATGTGVSVTVILALPRDLVSSFYRANRGLVQELQAANISCVIVSDAADLEVSRNEE